MYLLNKGKVKLYAENDIEFAIYRERDHFGDTDMILNQRRNGTAITIIETYLYKIYKNVLDNVIINFPDVKQMLHDQAYQTNKILVKSRI